MADFFEQDEYYRRKERIAAAAVQNEARALQEAEAAAKAKARSDNVTARANLSFLQHEYSTAGVRPPFVNEDGFPRVSLALLLDMGWRIEQVGGENTLVQPLHDIQPRKSRADYDQST